MDVPTAFRPGDVVMPDILLLAGTAEARALAALLAGRGADAVASLAGVTRRPAPYALPVRTGGFGGAAGLAAWLRAGRVRAVVDATHPFTARMPWHAAMACRAAGVARLRLLRPAWPTRTGWHVVGNLAEAAEVLPAGARVLLTTGREAAPFVPRTDCHFWLRSIEPVDLPAHIEPVLARPPFDLAAEIALMRRLGITHLVARNSGGDPARVDAAATLGVAVVMIPRPVPPPGPMVETAADAMVWLAGPGTGVSSAS